MQPFIRLKEIKDNLSKYAAQTLLDDGWVYLNSKVARAINEDGGFDEEVTYILGKPLNETTLEG